MTPRITYCGLPSCINNDGGLCTRREISLDNKATCEDQRTQTPLPEPSK